ncbi:MAG: AmmeMemoRadiSam system protein B [Candidatus Omnitrophota bacterium]|nr:AmmeMemoRadiSam system protein B [Candidatus Omnitrophota bacterium]
MVRHPAAAGYFYPNSQADLTKQIKKYVNKGLEKLPAIGAILPHAGYVYSGAVTGVTASQIGPKNSFVILGLNHRRQGKPYAIMTKGKWRTPLGDVEIDAPLGETILKNSDHLQEDPEAHANEHSIEVQLPFLQYLQPDARIVPITISGEEAGVFKKIGLEIARAVISLGRNSCILASSDMTHYEPEDSARSKDKQAINAILGLNEDLLLEKISELEISMCGYAPAVAMLSACKKLGAKRGRLIKYRTSGEVTGDHEQVVGYAGILIT